MPVECSRTRQWLSALRVPRLIVIGDRDWRSGGTLTYRATFGIHVYSL